MTFAEEVAARLPEGMTLPAPFAAVFDWAEAQGQAGVLGHGDPGAFSSRYLSIYPPEAMDEPGASHVLFRLDGPPFAEPVPEAVRERLVTIADAAGDGGKLGFWLDDAGQQWVVVIDHGWPYVLTDDPLVALTFLAMGYPEPAALPEAGWTAAEAALRWGADPPLLPDGYRAFLSRRFGVTHPARAADLGIAIPPPDDQTDPARIWLIRVMPQQEGTVGQTPETPFIITKQMQAHLDDETIALLRQTYDYVVLE